MNQWSFWDSAFISFDYVLRRGVARSYDSCILNILRNLRTLFHCGCTKLYSHQQCTGFPCLRVQHLLSLVFLVIAIPTDVTWYLTVALKWVSMLSSDVGHLFMCLLSIHMFSLEKCLVRSFAHSWIRLVFYCKTNNLIYTSSLYILHINFLPDIWLINIFCHSLDCLFILLIVSLTIQKLLFIVVQLVYFSFHCFCFWCHI